MSLLMDLIGPELSELSILELEKMLYLTYLQSSICKYRSISTKLGDSIYDQQISGKFNYGYNRIRTFRVICPCIRKKC